MNYFKPVVRNNRRRLRKVQAKSHSGVLNFLYFLFLVAFVVLYTKYIDLAWDSNIGSKLNVICMWILVVSSILPYILIKKIRWVILLLLCFLVSMSIIPETRIIVTILVVPFVLLLILAVLLAIFVGMGLKSDEVVEENGRAFGAVTIGLCVLIIVISAIVGIIWSIAVLKNTAFFGFNLW